LSVGNLTEPPPFNEMFDIICMTEVLETLKDPVRVMRNLRQRLKQGGTFIITVPNLTAFYPFYKLASPRLPRRLNMMLVPWEHPLGSPQPIDTALEYSEIRELIERAGLRIASIRGYEYVPYLLNAVPALKRRHLAIDNFLARNADPRRALRVFIRCDDRQ
jgi:2-polyprenyl-3-methyl-5-hydroxy-6-metoxy-1,4-benzoquinol methylase